MNDDKKEWQNDDKKEWQKKIPAFTTKFVHDDALEVGIEIYDPKTLSKYMNHIFTQYPPLF